MSPATPSAAPLPRRLALPALGGLLLALAMVRLPVAMNVDPLSAHRALLYETLRLGRDWSALGTTEGPLAALQTPVYLSGSLWMAVAWQLAGNLLLAGVLLAAAWRLLPARRVWALAALAGILARWPELAPWVVLVVLGRDLVHRWDREPFAVLPVAGLLGFLGLASLGHLLLGLLALGFVVATPRPPLARLLAAAGFALGLGGGWLALGQAPAALGRWLGDGLPLLLQTSPTSRLTDLAPFAPWALGAGLALALALTATHRAAPAATRSLPATLFLGGAAWLAWRAVALTDHGQPLVFFATLVLAVFLLWHEGARARWTAGLLVLGLGGLQAGHPDFLPGALGHFNRQMIFNARQLALGAQFRPALRADVAGLREAHRWTRLPALVGRAAVGTDAAARPRALLNQLAVVDPADARAGAPAPGFFLQRLEAQVGQPPAFVAAAAQLELYRHYSLETEESALLLWRRRATPTAAPVEVARGTLACGEPLKLPAAADTAYWLELEVAPSLLGRLWALVDERAEPGVIVRDEQDHAVRYPLPPAVGARGFLVDPFIRGDVEFAAWQRGGRPVRTAAVTVALPPASAWLWSNQFHYRLLAVPGLSLAGNALAGSAPTGFRSFSRRPVGSTYALPFIESTASPQQAQFFVHPDSLLEFAVTGTDRRVRGHFGIAPGAYAGPGRTDGVDFSVEFEGLDGRHQVLLRRYVDPAREAADRPEQEFDVALPGATGGRLLLRTFNPPERGAAWDWAFWRNVVIE